MISRLIGGNIVLSHQMLSPSSSSSLARHSSRKFSFFSQLYSEHEQQRLPQNPEHFPNTFINICPQSSFIVVETFGRFSETVQPGLFFAIPFVQKLKIVDMREITIPIYPQLSTTKDNVTVKASGALYVRAVDPKRLCYGAFEPLQAVSVHAQSAMRSAIGKFELDTIFHNRTVLNTELRDALRSAVEPWGIEATRYELTNIEPDERVAEAMDAQSIAERKRRETILNAEAQRQHEINISEGKKTAAINEAEGIKAKLILMAEGARQSAILKAEGDALALERMAMAISALGGKDAITMKIADQYLQALANGLTKSSTVFLPNDIGNVNSLVSQAVGIAKTMMQPKESV